MSTFIRGPICGTDNCPSRLWRIIDGRRTCQYGHVMEGDVEFNDDEDDLNGLGAGVITRRLNLTTNATGSFQSSQLTNSQLLQQQQRQSHKKFKKLIGHEAKLLFLKSFQFILKRQIRWLITEMRFPKEFEHVAKIIWLKILKTINDQPQEELKLQLHMTSTISILYLASTHLSLPVYTCDYIKWICTAKMPYFQASEILPKSWRIQLPNYYVSILEGSISPFNGQLYNKIALTCGMIHFKEFFNSEISCQGLLLKLVMQCALPPEFYFYTKQVIEFEETDIRNLTLWERTDERHTGRVSNHAELRVLSYFMLTINWMLSFDRDRQYPLKWILSLTESLTQRTTTSESIGRNIVKVVYPDKPTSSDYFQWSEEETLEFLKWMEKQFLPTQTKSLHNENGSMEMTIDQKIARRKLYKIFPLDREANHDGESNDSTHQLTFIEDLQERYAKQTPFFESNKIRDSLNYQEANPPARKEAIGRLLTHIASQLLVDFAISKEQLKDCISRIKNACLHRMN
ncbi:CNB_1a_G0029500.mRNA.1.CDS.1 [Saccharomyces cerevisiae]|nr:CNB_1a_G0029500.mRNA.1.CDS.1 [Saccharomyces cerevisiae]CAI5337940.1 AEL_HP2_G0027580.mRNA.1.CDS.1 [Saccharomyces cerevisiae]CAI6590046.1 AEL_HP1_G0029320.mRNA.1.CDS.1 [Saccharomyces cerevisiae]CAI6812756.1 AEL_HP2_G0027580.mRNA.1.CDS.1 [Saccharomyces cerevisiae]CAI7358089.1 CNB_1a_G0029500.mRNA.1.CDS.1 [Saccharomyces cerevisiae]